VLRLDLRAVGDLPTHAYEDVRDLLVEDGDRVLGTNLAAGGGLGDVDALGAERFLVALLLQLGLHLAEELFDATACHVDDAAGVLALILRQGAERAASSGDRSVVAEVRAAGLSEFLEVGRGGKGLLGGFGRRPHRLFRDFYSSLRRHWRFRQRGLLATRKNDYFRLQLSNLCFGGFVKAHTCRRGEVQGFRLPAHWDTHADISEVQPVPEPVRFV